MIRRPDTLYYRILNGTGPLLFRSRSKAIAAVLGGSVCLGASLIIPHTVAQDWTLADQQIHRKGVAVCPSPKVQLLVETAMTDLEFSEAEKASVRTFSVISENCTVIGSVKSFFGALIGLPAHLNAEAVEEVCLMDLSVPPSRSKKKWEAAAKLKESSLLSDKAKLFVIAEGLAHAREYSNYALHGILSSLCFIGAFVQSSTIINYSHFKTRVFVLKLPVYFVSFAMWIATYKFITDSVSYNQDKYILRYLSNLGGKYIEGGIEYYERMLISNQIINEICPFSYHESGDVSFMALPFTQRLAELKERKAGTHTE